MRRQTRVIIVGAGVGGLSCAIDLAARGFGVEVLERADVVGGKACNVCVGEVSIAAGPTVLTMPWVFDELFDAAGASFRSELPLERATILARHAWSDGTTLDLYADRQQSADAIGRAFGSSEARSYLAFCEDGRRIFEVAEHPFLRAPKLTVGAIVKQLGATGLKSLGQLDGHRTMWRALEQRFASPKLRQLFGRYATYVGSSPFDAPATLNLIAHVEAEGVYRAADGIRGLVTALERLARRLGVEIYTACDVTRVLVEGGRATGVVANDESHISDAVVFNGDISALGTGLLGKEASRAVGSTPRSERSLSAVTWMMKARSSGFPLVHHNVLFSDDYPAEFDALFRMRKPPPAPTVYICAQDRGDDGAPASAERLLVLSNAPASGDDKNAWDESTRRECTSAMTTSLQRAGLHLEPEAVLQSTPADFERRFPGTGGALYGQRSKGALTAILRSGAVTKIPWLYMAGGSVHPGAGVPMAALSGRLAARQIADDFGS